MKFICYMLLAGTMQSSFDQTQGRKKNHNTKCQSEKHQAFLFSTARSDTWTLPVPHKNTCWWLWAGGDVSEEQTQEEQSKARRMFKKHLRPCEPNTWLSSTWSSSPGVLLCTNTAVSFKLALAVLHGLLHICSILRSGHLVHETCPPAVLRNKRLSGLRLLSPTSTWSLKQRNASCDT